MFSTSNADPTQGRTCWPHCRAWEFGEGRPVSAWPGRNGPGPWWRGAGSSSDGAFAFPVAQRSGQVGSREVKSGQVKLGEKLGKVGRMTEWSEMKNMI